MRFLGGGSVVTVIHIYIQHRPPVFDGALPCYQMQPCEVNSISMVCLWSTYLTLEGAQVYDLVQSNVYVLQFKVTCLHNMALNLRPL